MIKTNMEKLQLFVQLEVLNVCTDAVPDAAAHVSVMSKIFYQKLRSPPVFSDYVILRGICESNSDSQICYNVPIEIGQFKGKWNLLLLLTFQILSCSVLIFLNIIRPQSIYKIFQFQSGR